MSEFDPLGLWSRERPRERRSRTRRRQRWLLVAQGIAVCLGVAAFVLLLTQGGI